MTPKEKAEELIKKYMIYVDSTLYSNSEQEWIHSDEEQLEQSKECALIAVDEMIEESIGYLSIDRSKYWKKLNKR